MSRALEVLKVLSPFLYNVNLAEAVELAERIDHLYTNGVDPISTPEGWAKAHVNDWGKNYPEKKINFIKDIRTATGTSLLEAKNAAEAAIKDAGIAALRDKLTGTATYTDYNYDEYYDAEEPPF